MAKDEYYYLRHVVTGLFFVKFTGRASVGIKWCKGTEDAAARPEMQALALQRTLFMQQQKEEVLLVEKK